MIEAIEIICNTILVIATLVFFLLSDYKAVKNEQ